MLISDPFEHKCNLIFDPLYLWIQQESLQEESDERYGFSSDRTHWSERKRISKDLSLVFFQFLFTIFLSSLLQRLQRFLNKEGRSKPFSID